MWDDYGCKRTTYEQDLIVACSKVKEYWDSQESRKESMKVHNKVMCEMYNKDSNPD